MDVHCDQELIGSQKGLPLCMTLGSDPYQLYLGTLGGYLMIYDLRYNLLSQQSKHFTRAPVTTLATFKPQFGNLTLNHCDASTPMVLVGTGGSNYEVSLLNLDSGAVEVLMTVDDRQSKESFIGGLPVVPSYMRESVFFESDLQGVKKNETNRSLLARYLATHSNAKEFGKLMNYQQQALVRNLDEDWLKNSKNRFMNVKTAYESSNACRKIFVPRIGKSLLDRTETTNFAITGGNDRKLRFWDFTNLKKKSYCINSPNDDEAIYSEEHQGETMVIQEKVQQYKTFP